MRTPVGVEIILEILSSLGLTPGRSHLLDAGCGTGSYLHALAGQFHRLTGLELNKGMLARATQKLGKYKQVALFQGSIEDLPFPDNLFDVVIVNQVIQHLDQVSGEPRPTWPVLTSALTEVHRSLKPGGALVINTCSRDQVFDGFWYTDLVPHAVQRMAQRYIPIPDLEALLKAIGFDVGRPQIPLQEVFSAQRFLDPTGPFEKSWRDGDSLWALATEVELRDGLARLQHLIDTGQISSFMNEREAKREATGQATFIPAQKPW